MRSTSPMEALARGRTTFWPVVAGVAVVALIAGYDASNIDSHSIVVGMVVLGPFLAALLGTAEQTAAVVVVSLAAVALSALWNSGGADQDYVFRVSGVIGGGTIAVLAARGRDRTTLVALRFGALSAISDIVDGSDTLSETAQRLAEVLVPSVADVFILDTLQDGALVRLAVRVAGAGGDVHEAFLNGRRLTEDTQGIGQTAALTRNAGQLIQFSAAVLQSVAHDAGDAAGLGALGLRTFTVVPLRARGFTLGTLTLAVTDTSRRRFGPDDLGFHEVVAGRAALALDNVALDRELRHAERQLGIALGALDEAVTVTNPAGYTLYANDAAVTLLGFDNAEDLYAMPPAEVMELYDVYDEDGTALTLANFEPAASESGEAPPAMLVRNVLRSTGEERWLWRKAAPITDDSGKLLRMVNVIEDVTAIKLAELRAQLLAEASDLLAASLDYERTLQQVAELAVPGLADWCIVSLPDRESGVRTAAVAHVDPGKVGFVREMAERYPDPGHLPIGPAAVIKSGQTQVIIDVADEVLQQVAQDAEHLALLKTLGARTGVIVPMRAAGTVVGALTLLNAESPRPFAAGDVALAEELARRAGTAVQNARLFTERARITATLQEGLLPARLPVVPGWTVASYYNPAGALNEVGGDFYDVFETAQGWMLVVGDVTGHGAQAAKLTAVARFALRAVAELTGDPLQAIGQLNRMLLAEPELALVTLVCVLLGEPVAGERSVDIVRCGHPAPLLVGAAGAAEVGAVGPILGALEARWDTERVTMRAGETLLLFTDGITDALGPSERFGTERLIAVVDAAASELPAALVARVAGAVRAFATGSQQDDEALLALRCDAAPGPP